MSETKYPATAARNYLSPRPVVTTAKSSSELLSAAIVAIGKLVIGRQCSSTGTV